MLSQHTMAARGLRAAAAKPVPFRSSAKGRGRLALRAQAAPESATATATVEKTRPEDELPPTKSPYGRTILLQGMHPFQTGQLPGPCPRSHLFCNQTIHRKPAKYSCVVMPNDSMHLGFRTRGMSPTGAYASLALVVASLPAGFAWDSWQIGGGNWYGKLQEAIPDMQVRPNQLP